MAPLAAAVPRRRAAAARLGTTSRRRSARALRGPRAARASGARSRRASRALAVLFGGLYLGQGPRVDQAQYVAVIADQATGPVWLLQAFTEELRVSTINPRPVPAGNSYELWMLPNGGAAPVSLGLIPGTGNAALPLSAQALAVLAQTLDARREPRARRRLADGCSRRAPSSSRRRCCACNAFLTHPSACFARIGGRIHAGCTHASLPFVSLAGSRRRRRRHRPRPAPAAGARARDEIVVLGRWDNPLGFSRSASQGVVGNAEIEARPRLRTGEILEVVPGLIVTQHSGSGKSNQMFLRGFNLDHGTDFATFVDGMPVNLPTHGHGQGYTDLNFLIPELVERLEYRKGAYYAEVADFSSAGAAYLSTYRQPRRGLDQSRRSASDGYLTALAADSVALRRRQPHLRRPSQSLRRPLDRHRRGCDAQPPAAALCGRGAGRRRLERGAHGLRRAPGTRPTKCRAARSRAA